MPEQRIKALVTGASAGLGAEFCRQLAPRCDEILLVARRGEALEALAAELTKQGAEANVLVADLADPIGIAATVEAIRQRGPFAYLVNNAGFATHGNFADVDLHKQQAMVNLHIAATLSLSQAAIAGMSEAGQGAIINVASLVALAPFAGVAVYGGTKAFLVNYSQALQQELSGSGVKVQCLCPGYTRTEFHGTASMDGFDPATVPDKFWMESADVVRDSLAALEQDQVVVVSGEFNRGIYAHSLRQQLEQLQA